MGKEKEQEQEEGWDWFGGGGREETKVVGEFNPFGSLYLLRKRES